MGFDGAGDGPLIAPVGIHHAEVLAPPFVLAAQDVDAGDPTSHDVAYVDAMS